MSEAEQSQAKLLADLLKREPPHPDASFPLLPLSSKTFGVNNQAFIDLTDELAPLLTKTTRLDTQAEHRKTLQHVLFSLVHAMFRWEVLALPTNSGAYENDRYFSKLSTRRITERIIMILAGQDEAEQQDQSIGWMFLVRKGFRGANGTSEAAVYFPTRRFIELFLDALYTDFGGWDDLTNQNLYRFKEFQLSDLPSYATYADKIKILRSYNQFMREQSWAMKNPSYRAMGMYSPRSGRIINHYQNIANRRYPLRTNTLLNGGAIEECDFSANHLWMFSYLVGEELPQDAYEAIVKTTGCTRLQVKHVTTKLLGSTSKQQRGRLIQKAPNSDTPCTADQFKAIESALYSEYPWLLEHNAFYHDRGAWLQGLEGEISLLMLQWATENQIPLIAVHDAYAVNKENAPITEEVMHDYRKQILDQAVHSRFLDLASSKQPSVVLRTKQKKAKKGGK